MFIFKKKQNNKFYIVSLLKRKPFHYKLWLCVLGSILVTATIVFISEVVVTIRLFNINIGKYLIYLLIPFLLYILYRIWKWFFNNGRNRYPFQAIKQLLYFIKANNLYQTDTVEKIDINGKVKKKKYISNSVCFGCYEDNKFLYVRAYKNADTFNDKMNDLDTGLSSLFGLVIDNKIDKVAYCDYIFKKIQDKRIIVTGQNDVEINKTTNLPLNNNLNWNILKQPHLLLAGVTGSGKTTFLNYLIIEMKKMQSEVYICDPKKSDLSSLQHFFGKKYVASETNMIAKLTREVKEIMNNRFVDYKENAENFVYGHSFVDYGLSPIFLVFDELGAFRAGAEKKIFTETMDNLTEIILKGREMGVFCVLSTQQPNANNIPTELRDNLSVRLAMGSMSNEAYRMVFGEVEDLQTINTIGGGYIYLDGLGWEKPKYFEAPFLDYKNFNFIEEVKRYV